VWKNAHLSRGYAGSRSSFVIPLSSGRHFCTPCGQLVFQQPARGQILMEVGPIDNLFDPRNPVLWAGSEFSGSAQEMYVFKSEARSTIHHKHGGQEFETRLKIQNSNVRNETSRILPKFLTIQQYRLQTWELESLFWSLGHLIFEHCFGFRYSSRDPAGFGFFQPNNSKSCPLGLEQSRALWTRIFTVLFVTAPDLLDTPGPRPSGGVSSRPPRS